MTVLDVSVNGRRLCRAGVGADGVLDAIVSWAKLTGRAAATARRLTQPLEETRLHVGGLRGDTHRRWVARELQIGDRVGIDVVSATRWDPPLHERRRDPRLAERQERRYYQRLKRRFEGPGHRAAARRTPVRKGDTRFLNVDLDIWSRSALDSLVAAFGSRVFVLHAGREGRRYAAHLELASSGLRDDADQMITRFVALIRRLPRPARSLWNRAPIREFNVGIQAGATPFSYVVQLEPATLDGIASIGARVGFTVYGAAGADGTE
jgi:hypothetical protein